MNKDTLLPDEKNPVIWINPGRMSGVPCFYKTRLPVDSLFENLEDGVSLDEYADAFEISREKLVAVLEYTKGKMPATEEKSWQEFREQCRRQMARPLAQRIKYGFCRMHKPVLDDAESRVFETMAEYRAWCANNLPEYLGFKPAR